MNSLERVKKSILCPDFFFLLKCLFPLLFPFCVTQTGLWSALFFPLQTGCLLLSSSPSSDVPRCEAALGQQEAFKMCISDLENATVCTRFEDSCTLSRDCHISVDLFDGFSRISARRGKGVSSREKVLAQVYIKTFTDLQIKCEIWIFLAWKYIHNPVLVSTTQGLFLLLQKEHSEIIP